MSKNRITIYIFLSFSLLLMLPSVLWAQATSEELVNKVYLPIVAGNNSEPEYEVLVKVPNGQNIEDALKSAGLPEGQIKSTVEQFNSFLSRSVNSPTYYISHTVDLACRVNWGATAVFQISTGVMYANFGNPLALTPGANDVCASNEAPCGFVHARGGTNPAILLHSVASTGGGIYNHTAWCH